MIAVLISASAGWDGTVHLTRNLTLQRGKITRLRVRLTGGEPLEGNISLSVSYDETFDEGYLSEIEVF